MMISFYFDEMMARAVTKGMKERGYNVVMAADVEMLNKDDDTERLVYARENNLVLVTRDYPFAGRTTSRTDHAGLICWTGQPNNFGGQIRVLAEFSDNHTSEDVRGKVFWLNE